MNIRNKSRVFNSPLDLMFGGSVLVIKKFVLSYNKDLV